MLLFIKSLGDVDRLPQGPLQEGRAEGGDDGEHEQGGVVESGVVEGYAVEGLVDVDEEVPAHGEYVGEDGDGAVHGLHGVGEGGHGEGEDAYEGGHRQGESGVGYDGAYEDSEALAGHHEEEHGQGQVPHRAVVGEVVEVEHQGVDSQAEDEENDGLWEEFAEEGGADASAGVGEPSGRGAGFDFLGDGEDGHEEYHELQHSGEEGGREVVGVVEVWVAQGVVVDDHRLQDEPGGSVRGAFRYEVLLYELAGGCDGQGLEPFVDEGSGDVVGEVGVEGECRGPSGECFALEVGRDYEEAVDFATLDGVHGVVVAFFLAGDVAELGGVELPGYAAGDL